MYVRYDYSQMIEREEYFQKKKGESKTNGNIIDEYKKQKRRKMLLG